jgi:uncharacterized protein DUF6992
VDPWERQRALGRTTIVWSALSIAAGLIFATRHDRWWRAFGQQHAGWGVVDVLIVAVAARLKARRMRRLPDPYDQAAMRREQRTLRAVLLGNVVADAGYVAAGAVLWSREDPRASGAGGAIVLQGLFLLLHDAYHAYGSRPT